MKKLLIAVLAVAGLASCTNTVEFEPVQKQIGLSPITENRTRAMVSGTAFPDEQFMVWAWYKQLPAGTTIAQWQEADATTYAQQNYINEKPFESKATTQNAKGKLWAGVTPYFWPKQGSLLFAGYYPTTAETKTAADGITYEFDGTKNVMTINGYTPGDYTTTGFVKTDVTNNHSEDLMYFKMTEASCNSATNGPVNVTNEPNVDVVFQHALSWIKVTLAKAADTPEKAIITVNSVKFTGVNTTGTGTVTKCADIVWDVTGSATADIVVWNDDTQELSATAIEVPKEPVIIPQTISTDCELVINYTIASEEKDGSYSSFTETKAVKLANDISVDEWEAGKCYTYNITIGTSEILIDPKVTDWADVEIPVVIK